MQTAVLADLYGNIEALDAGFAQALVPGRSVTSVSGGFVGHGPDPAAVMRRVRKLPGLIAFSITMTRCCWPGA